MTLVTPNYSFPYPELTDTPNGATETQALASAVDTALAAEAATRAAADTTLTNSVARSISEPVAALMYRTVSVSVANVTWTKLSLDTAAVDPAGVCSVSNSRIVPGVVGYYLVTVGGCYVSNGTGGRFVACYKNGSVIRGGTAGLPAVSGATPTDGIPFKASIPISITATTDYLELWTWQNSGGSLGTFADSVNVCSLAVTPLRTS